MTEQEFEQIRERLGAYVHTSLHYAEWAEVAHFSVLRDTPEAIVLYGYDREADVYAYHFAANDAPAVSDTLTRKHPNEKLSFVPEAWIPQMESLGFSIQAIWSDYFADGLETRAIAEAPVYLSAADADAAARVTMACRGQSRGFTGQTPDWVRGWLAASAPACPSSTSDTAILGAFAGDRLCGVVCVGIYGEPERRILWIREIAVHPSEQGKGVGRRLLGQAFCYGVSHGADSAFLMADACNAHAIRLYAGMGFQNRPEDAQIDMLRP